MAALAAAPPPLTIVQHSRHDPLQDRYGRLARIRTVRQGDNVLSFFSVEET
jgi:hypothetical protein